MRHKKQTVIDIAGQTRQKKLLAAVSGDIVAGECIRSDSWSVSIRAPIFVCRAWRMLENIGPSCRTLALVSNRINSFIHSAIGIVNELTHERIRETMRWVSLTCASACLFCLFTVFFSSFYRVFVGLSSVSKFFFLSRYCVWRTYWFYFVFVFAQNYKNKNNNKKKFVCVFSSRNFTFK